MAIAYSTALANGSTVASTGFLVGPFTVSDTGTVLVGLIGFGESANHHFAGMFWDSTTLNSTFTQIAASTSASGRAFRAFYLANPAIGSHSVRVAYTSASVAQAAAVALYTGINDAGAVDAALSTNGASTGVGATVTSEAGDLVVGIALVQAEPSTGVLTPNNGGTKRLDFGNDFAGNNLGLLLADWSGAASVDSSVSWGSTSREFGYVAVNLNAGAVGGGSTPMYRRTRTLLGVGG